VNHGTAHSFVATLSVGFPAHTMAAWKT
jgi:hypothetical protein